MDLDKAVRESYLKQFSTKFDGDVFWSIFPGALIFFMHAGFAMLETGSIVDKHKVNVLYKNISTVIVGGISFFLFGFGFAYGNGRNNSFIGGDKFFASGLNQNRYTNDTDRSDFFFQFTFCITCATIVSGAIVGRMRLEAYLTLVVVMSGFIFPTIAHWTWSDSGFLSAFKGSDPQDIKKYLFNSQYPNACGVIDFAGSGVIHVTGGTAALISAYIVGPRSGRFNEDGSVNPMPGHNLSIATLGTFILWFGWFAFNSGSTLEFVGEKAAKIVVITAISPSTSFLTHLIVQRNRTGKYDLPGALNAILSGLVSITGACATISDFSAIIVGFIAALLYIYSSEMLLRNKIDDPLNASCVHLFCGLWGVIVTSIFSTPENHAAAYDCPVPLKGSENADWLEPLPGYQVLQQFILVLVIVLWVSVVVTPILLAFKRYNFLRVSVQQEERGLDCTEHNVIDYQETAVYGTIKQDSGKVKVSSESEVIVMRHV